MAIDTDPLPPVEALECALGGVEERNGVLVPTELARASAGTFATTPAIPPATFDEVRLQQLEIENEQLKAKLSAQHRAVEKLCTETRAECQDCGLVRSLVCVACGRCTSCQKARVASKAVQ